MTIHVREHTGTVIEKLVDLADYDHTMRMFHRAYDVLTNEPSLKGYFFTTAMGVQAPDGGGNAPTIKDTA
jgi:hypothetical protein